MRKVLINIFFILCAVGLYTCKTPYSPTPITTTTNYLVVEGFINITDSTYINLSRTVIVSAKTTAKPELKATVTIEDNKGASYPLKELGNGMYAAGPLSLSVANQYHIRIKTSNGNQYTSDFADTKVSPPIDSITYGAKSTTLEIYANTHDANNATHYYRWDYTEAWEFHSNYFTTFISDGINIIPRTPNQLIWDCFTGDVSGNITVGSSIQLSKDVISRQVINTIPSDAEKIGIKYTIGVKQYALTKDAYDYWALLRKNTEQLGSIFDAQPSASIGNIHNIANPAEPVIGYISAGTVTTRRIFITKSQLPAWTTTPFYPTCTLDTILKYIPLGIFPEDYFINFKSARYQGPGTQEIPVAPIGDANSPDGYLSAVPKCVDCTLRGSKIPPAYWK